MLPHLPRWRCSRYTFMIRLQYLNTSTLMTLLLPPPDDVQLYEPLSLCEADGIRKTLTLLVVPPSDSSLDDITI